MNNVDVDQEPSLTELLVYCLSVRDLPLSTVACSGSVLMLFGCRTGTLLRLGKLCVVSWKKAGDLTHRLVSN